MPIPPIKEWKSKPTSEGYWWVDGPRYKEPAVIRVISEGRPGAIFDFDSAVVYMLGSSHSYFGRDIAEAFGNPVFQKVKLYEK